MSASSDKMRHLTSSSHQRVHPSSLRKVKKRLDFLDRDDGDDESDLDFTDKLKAFRSLLVPKKQVLVKRESEEWTGRDSENDLQTLVKKKSYPNLAKRPTSAGPESVRFGNNVNSAKYCSVGVYSEGCFERPCSAHDLASRLEQVDQQLKNHEFRSPGRYRDRGLVHSTPDRKPRTSRTSRNDELENQKEDDKDFVQISQEHHNSRCQIKGQEKDVNNKKKEPDSGPDIYVLLDQLKRNRKKHIHRSEEVSAEKSSPFRPERPQSCVTQLNRAEKEKFERPQSCVPATSDAFLKRFYRDRVSTSVDVPSFQDRSSLCDSVNSERISVKKNLSSSVRQTNVPFFDEVASPDSSGKKVSEGHSQKRDVPNSELSELRDGKYSDFIFRHHTEDNGQSEDLGQSKTVRSRQLEYVRNLHNEAVGDRSRESPVDAPLHHQNVHSCRRIKVSKHRSRQDHCDDQPLGSVNGKRHFQRLAEKTSNVKDNLQLLSDKYDGSGDNKCYTEMYSDDNRDKRKTDLDVDFSDSESSRMTLKELRELHNRAFTSSSDTLHDLNSCTDSESENYNKEYLLHKTTWNKEQKRYQRNLHKLNKLMERRSVTPLCDRCPQRLLENVTVEQRSVTPASYELQRKFLLNGQEKADSYRQACFNRIERNHQDRIIKISKHRDDDVQDEEIKRSLSGFESPVKSNSCVSSDSPCKTPKPENISNHEYSSDKYQRLNSTDIPKMKQVDLIEFHQSRKMFKDYQRSRTPGSDELSQKLQSRGGSERHSVDLVSEEVKTSNEVRKSSSNSHLLTKQMNKPESESPLKSKSRVIKRETPPSKSAAEGKSLNKLIVKKETLPSKSTSKRETSPDKLSSETEKLKNKLAIKRDTSPSKLKSKLEISPNKLNFKNETSPNKLVIKTETSAEHLHMTQIKNSSKLTSSRKGRASNAGRNNSADTKIISRSKSATAATTAESDEPQLSLDDVRKFHQEVDRRLQEKISNSFNCDQSDSESSTNGERISNHKKHSYPGRGTESYRKSKKLSHKVFDCDGQEGSGDQKNNRDSVEMSADITIPELFGMKITKTVKRVAKSLSSFESGDENWKLDGNDLQYEVTITDGCEARHDHHQSSFNHTDDDSKFRSSSRIYLSQNGQVSNVPGQNRFVTLNMTGQENKDIERQCLTGEKDKLKFSASSSVGLENEKTERQYLIGERDKKNKFGTLSIIAQQKVGNKRHVLIAREDESNRLDTSNLIGQDDNAFKRQHLIGQRDEDLQIPSCNRHNQRRQVRASKTDENESSREFWDTNHRSDNVVASQQNGLPRPAGFLEKENFIRMNTNEHSKYSVERENSQSKIYEDQSRMKLSSERSKDLLDGMSLVGVGNINGRWPSTERFEDAESSKSSKSSLIFEPPEKDTSTPLKNTQLTRQHGIFNKSRTYQYTAADTIIAHLGDPETVRLLQKIYTTSENIRPQLILKAKYFKKWQKNVQSLTKQRRLNDKSFQKACCFHDNHLMSKCFHHWLSATTSQQQNRKARELYRRIMLRKGVDAFKWAISRSHHCYDIMQSRVKNIVLTTAFVKWHRLTEERQKRRLGDAFTAWRKLTVEVQSLRTFEHGMNKKLAQKTLSKWKDMFVVHVKQHRADGYNRRTLLKHMFTSWSLYTSSSKQQAQRHQLAITQYRGILQKKMFCEMKAAHRKYEKAKWHYGHKKLGQFFTAWRKVIDLCKLEQEENLKMSTTHWNLTTTRSYFLQWKVAIGNLRAKRMADKNVVRHTFTRWKTVWQEENERRRNIEERIKMNKVCHTFRCWRKNVVTRKRQQKKAVMLLEGILLQQTLLDWHQYADYKKQLNNKLKTHTYHCSRRRVGEHFSVWHKLFQHKVDTERARKFWSDKCVLKCVRKWKHVCRKRRLRTLLIESEPDRQLRCLQVMFHRWLATKQQAELEELEASESREILNRCQLRRRFIIWRLETLQSLTIKPLVLRKQRHLVSRCFSGWLEITKHKLECRNSKIIFLKAKLRHTFHAWKRQFEVCQLGKQIGHRMDMGLVICCLQEWSFVLQRKHAAQQFSERCCVRNTFSYWKKSTANQLQAKADAKEKEEENMALKRFYFGQWLTSVQAEVAEDEDAVNKLHQRQAYSQIRNSFLSWRDHLHATIIARAYKKNLCQRLMRTVLLEWQLVTDQSLADAVQRFADQLGIQLTDERDSDVSSLSGYHSNNGESELYLNSPRSSSSTTCSFRRLFGVADSDRSEPDGMSLISHGFLESSNIEDKMARSERIKHIVFMVVNRLRHWPVSVVFDQWKEYTVRRLELKKLGAQLTNIHDRCVLTVTLRNWRVSYLAFLHAKKHRNHILVSRTFAYFHWYVKRRKEKTKQLCVARRHHMMLVFQKMFPVWLTKTQQRLHNKHILRLWSTTTPEEQRLIPLEHQLTRQFCRRSLSVCFSVWLLKHKFIVKIKHAYNTGLVKNCFQSWHVWAHKRHEHQQKCEVFKQRRVLSMTFKTWIQQLQMKRETESRFNLAWSKYLQFIVQTWLAWTKANQKRRRVARELIDRQDRNVLRQRFQCWCSLTKKLQRVKRRCNALLLSNIVHQWHLVVMEKQKEEKKILEFRVNSYTRLVKVLFKRWCRCHAWRLRQKEKEENFRRHQALVVARQWRKKTQASRGQRLHQHLTENKIRACFSKWKQAFHKCVIREEILHQHLTAKNRVCLSVALETWHTHYLGNQAAGIFSLKLQATVIAEWNHWTRAARERRIRGLALQKALEERNLHIHFKYWLGLTQVQQSVRTHVGLKIQTRILQAWHQYVLRKRHLSQIQQVITKKVNLRIITLTFMSMRCQFDYCQGLSDIADNVIRKKNEVLLRSKLLAWKLQLDSILASRCYGKILAVRVARQWKRFVKKREDERMLEKKHNEMAEQHYNKKLCKLAVSALYSEVLVSRQLRHHQEKTAMKFARQWKHQADLSHTACSMDEERLYLKSWHCWRLEFIRRKSARTIDLYNRRQTLTQIFSAWHHLSQKKRRRSLIPVAVTSGQGQIQSRSSSIPVPVNTRNLAESLRRSRVLLNPE